MPRAVVSVRGIGRGIVHVPVLELCLELHHSIIELVQKVLDRINSEPAHTVNI